MKKKSKFYNTEASLDPKYASTLYIHGRFKVVVQLTLYQFCFEPVHFNPLGPNSDQHQISPCYISVYSTPQVMRIKDNYNHPRWIFLIFS